MRNLQPFIDLGFYTVPLEGELKRLEDGTKTTPKYKKNWKTYFQNNFNERPTKLGGTITGAISNIIAIDCDSQVTYDIFKALDTTNSFEFVSKGKPKGGCTIIYRYPHIEDGSLPLPSFSIQDEHINLDFYSDNGFVYLPTDANETKVAWEVESLDDMPPIVDMPNAVKVLLHSLYRQYVLSKAKTTEDDSSTPKPMHRINYLAPQIELMIAKGEFIPSVFHIITPKDFRTLEQYVQHGYLHPSSVPDGRGSEYLSKISAILGADPSISTELYQKAISFINDLWDEPIPQNRLKQTIITPMLEGQAKVDGESLWRYDEYWKTRGLTFTTKFGDAAEVFFDDVRAIYYLVNNTSSLVKSYQRDSDIYSYMDAVGVAIPSRKEFKPLLPLVRTVSDPSQSFGFYSKDEYTRMFNIFKQTPALRILNDPIPYKHLYKHPKHIIEFFRSLVPDPIMRNYLLRFLKKKLTSFNYSPVVLYFLGTHGSGKDTFVNLLGYILGDDYISKPTTKEFLEQFNGWIVDTYFTQLDEYGNQLSTLSDKEAALGKIKYISGKKSISIRQMRTDGFSYDHATTIIMTANKNPLILEDGDRRAAFFNTPNTLKDESWVIQAGGISKVQDLIHAEVNDFCYYLAMEVDALSADDYVNPPATEQKHKLIANSLPAAGRLVYWLRNHMYQQLYNVAAEYDLEEVFKYSVEGRLYEEDLYTLYLAMTDDKGIKRSMSMALKDSGFNKIPSTRDGQKAYYYRIDELKYFVPTSGGFSSYDEDEKVEQPDIDI